MNQPLGTYSGLSCEILECINALNNYGSKDLMDVVFDLGKIALSMAEQKNPKEKMKQVIDDGSAFEIFDKMVYEHGGNLKKIKNEPLNITEIISSNSGYLKYQSTKVIGDAVNFLTLGSKIDNNAGIKIVKKNNDFVHKGDVILKLFGENKVNIEIAKKNIEGSFTLNEKIS